MKQVIIFFLMVNVVFAGTGLVNPLYDFTSVHIDGLDVQTQATFDDLDQSPDAVGEFLYDNTVTGLDDGAFLFYDDDEIQILIALDSSEALASGDDGKLLQYNWNGGAGYWDLVVNSGGDMTKAVYDTLNNGLVDGADVALALNWDSNPDATSKNTIFDAFEELHFNIETFGAVGDNATDNTAAIQAAIDAAAVNAGGALFIPDGIFLITSSLNIPDGLKMIYGVGDQSEIRADAAMDAIFDYTSGGTDSGPHTTITIKDISLRGSNLANYCVFINRMTRSNFIRVKAKFAVLANYGCVATDSGIFILNFIGCHASSSLQDGFLFSGSNINAINIIGCFIEDNDRIGINMTLGNKIHIEGCTIEANGEAAIWVKFVKSLSITNNYFESNATTGVAVTNPTSFTIKADVILSGGTYPVISSVTPSRNLIIQGNNHATNTADTMYYASGITNGVISNNYNATSGDNCLEVYGNRDSSEISGLKMDGNADVDGLFSDPIVVGDAEPSSGSFDFHLRSHTIQSDSIPHKNNMPLAFESYTKIVDASVSSTLTRNPAAFHGLDAFTITKAGASSDIWGATLNIDADYPELSGKLCYFGGWLKWDAGSDNNGLIYTSTTGSFSNSNKAALTDWTFVSVMFTMPASGATAWECGFRKFSAGSSDVLHVAFPVLARVGDGYYSHLPEMNPVLGGTGEAGSPNYLRLHDLDGVLWSVFAATDGTARIHNAIPTSDSDGSPIGTSGDSFTFTDEDASPTVVGEFKYDNTITGLADGSMELYDGDEVQTAVLLDSSEVLAAGDDGFVLQYNWNGGAGFWDLVVQAGAAGGDAWSDAVDSHILPTGADNTYDLGSAAASFKDIFWDGTATGNVTGDLTGTASLATTVTVSDDEATADDHEIVFTTDNLNLESDGNFKYNPSTGTATATEFVGGGVGLTGIVAVHAGTITWTGTSILESGAAFQFGDATDATLTHTYANTGTNVAIAYSSAAMDITGGLSTTLDLTISGDDLFMNTNTDQALLVADGTNFNPVVPTGDVLMDNTGVVAIQIDTIGTAEMADADHGDVSWTGGVATVEDFTLVTDADAGANKITNLADPTLSQDAATKEYVDTATGFQFDYFFSDTASDIGGIYFAMTDVDLGGGESPLATGSLIEADDQPLVNFATLSGEPGVLELSAGVYHIHLHAERTGGNRTTVLYGALYKRELDTTETLLGTTEISNAITTKTEVELHMSIATEITILATDRLIIKMFANCGNGTNSEITLYQEGNTSSRFTFATTSAILSTLFVRQDGTTPLVDNWDVGPFTIQGTQFISDIVTGTAPFVVASTTEVANLLAATATLAADATTLETPRTIGGVSFDGSANIVPTTIVVADTEDATTFVGLWTDATGSLLPKTDEQLTFVANTGVLTAAGFAGPLTGAVTGAASGNLLNSESDILIGTLTADGLTLGQDENITLGAQTLDHDGTDFVFNDSVNIGANAFTTSVPIKSEPKHFRFNIINPLAAQTEDTQIGIVTLTDAALTITNIKISLDAAGNEVAGDLMFADAFIGFANATVINVCDTTSGVLDDSAMADGTIPSGKVIYFQFDSAPNTAITQMLWDITYDYD